MVNRISKDVFPFNLRIGLLIFSFLSFCIFGTCGLDWLTASVNQSSFYFSESFMFSSFWWLFLPGLLLQFRLANIFKSTVANILLIALPVLLHLFAYPALVWALSTAFYYHSFAYGQTFHFELQAYAFILLFAYTLPFIFFKIMNQKKQATANTHARLLAPAYYNTITSIWVNDGKKKIQIQTADIFYISASSPYIQIHLHQKKYLHNQSLKSISQLLDDKQFVRIHKSCMVNINKIASCSSRQNGDYDITLNNGMVLRLSRNYTVVFRERIKFTHQVAL